jgi:hypothetical protein
MGKAVYGKMISAFDLKEVYGADCDSGCGGVSSMWS